MRREDEPARTSPDVPSSFTPNKAQLASALVALASEPAFLDFPKVIDGVFARAQPAIFRLTDAFKRLDARPPIAGYEHFFIENGLDACAARIMATTIRNCGARWVGERELGREFSSLVKLIIRHRSTTSGRARLFALTASGDLDGLSTWSVPAAEILPLIVSLHDALAASSPERASPVTIAAAKALLPHLPESRGRKLSAASAAHVLLYLTLQGLKVHFGGYTYAPPPEEGEEDPKDVKEDYIDDVTRATRDAFGFPFKPQAAWRLFQKHRDVLSASDA